MTRISDERLAHDVEHVKHFQHTATEGVMLPAGYVGDLDDARATIRHQQAEINRLRKIPQAYLALEALVKEGRAPT